MTKHKLGDICEIVSGTTPKSNVPEYWGGDIKWITPAELNDDSYIVNDSVRKITTLGVRKTGLSPFPEGTVILSTRAPIGKVAIAGCEMYCNQGFKNLICSDAIYNKYLYWFLKGKTQYLNSLGRGATFKEISKSIVSDIELELPSIDAQQTIVEHFETIASIIRLRQQQLSALDDLIKSRFVEMFREQGQQVFLRDYVWFQEGPGVRSIDFTSDGTILLTGSNINDNQITFGYKSDRHISCKLANGKYAHFICDVDDILVVSSAIDPNKFDKKVTIVKEDKKYCLNTGIIRFKPNKKYLSLGYFREFLKTDYFKHQVIEEMRGIAQMHFGPSHLNKMMLLLPKSLKEQANFDEFVIQIDKSRITVQQSLNITRTLLDSLMQKYFG